MKKALIRSSITFAVALTFSAFALAQHGRPAGAGPGMGSAAGAGMGAGMGADHSMNSGAAGLGHANTGSGMSGMGSGRANMGSHSPSSVLSNPKLNTSLTNALGKSGISIPGGNLQTACAGFKNLGECVAAMHVAKNLNLPFSELQSSMTGSNSESLGKAIKSLGGPNVKSKSEAKKANKQANQDLKAAQSLS